MNNAPRVASTSVGYAGSHPLKCRKCERWIHPYSMAIYAMYKVIYFIFLLTSFPPLTIFARLVLQLVQYDTMQVGGRWDLITMDVGMYLSQLLQLMKYMALCYSKEKIARCSKKR